MMTAVRQPPITLHLSPENIGTFSKFRATSTTTTCCTNEFKISVDFGPAPGKSQFHDFINAALTLPNPVWGLSFLGTAPSFHLDEFDCLRLTTLLQSIAPGLRTLRLFNTKTNWRLAEGGRFLRHFHSAGTWLFESAFPQLEELILRWEECAVFLFDALLRPQVVPRLVRLQIDAQAPGNTSRPVAVSLRRSLEHLAGAGRALQLTELGLTLNERSSFDICYQPFQLPTVRRLQLRILRCRGNTGLNGCDAGGDVHIYGDFIERMFPQLVTLDLQYDGSRAQADSFSFPGRIGQLAHLQSLSVVLWEGGDLPWGGTPLQLQLRVFGWELMSSFPSLHSVTVDFGLQFYVGFLYHGQQLQFATVRRLELRNGMCRAFALPSKTIKNSAAQLHGLYPQISCMVLDFGPVTGWESSMIAAQLLIEEFGPLEELELLNCVPEYRSLAELLGDKAPETIRVQLAVLRSLTLKMGTQPPNITTARSNRTKGLTLTSIMGSCPQLEWIEGDAELLAVMAGCSVTEVYEESAALQGSNSNAVLKIKLD